MKVMLPVFFFHIWCYMQHTSLTEQLKSLVSQGCVILGLVA
jgi:hypothetical protein